MFFFLLALQILEDFKLLCPQADYDGLEINLPKHAQTFLELKGSKDINIQLNGKNHCFISNNIIYIILEANVYLIFINTTIHFYKFIRLYLILF